MDRVLALLCSVLFGLPTAAAARQLGTPHAPAPTTFEVVPLSPEQETELTTWLTALKKWQQYDEKWRNRPARDGWGRIADRRPSPTAPDWLGPYCASVAAAGLTGFEERTEIACRVFADPRASFAAVPPPVSARLSAEKPPPHSSFFTRLHLDGMWSTTSTNGRLYGIVGTHMSLVDIGRIQVFGPPGLMLLTVPDGQGGRQVQLGYTWGLSIRLGDVRINAPTKNMTVFLNISKVFLGSTETTAGSSRGYDIVGFSIAPRKKK
jgi:hypothetical protein